MLANTHETWAVWQSITGQYPFEISPGWFMTMTCASKEETPDAGSLFKSEVTMSL